MAFRLLRYAVAAMQRHLEAGHKKLPLVIPVLFYTGKRSPYPYSTRWLDEFDNPAVAEKLYGGPFPLTDITVIPDDDIMNHRSADLTTEAHTPARYSHADRPAGHTADGGLSFFISGDSADTLFTAGRRVGRL